VPFVFAEMVEQGTCHTAKMCNRLFFINLLKYGICLDMPTTLLIAKNIGMEMLLSSDRVQSSAGRQPEKGRFQKYDMG
jgi:hypothetical protein